MENKITDEDILRGLGITTDSNSDEAQQLIASLRIEVANRFSEGIADLLTDEQLDEFEDKKSTLSFAEMQKWLEGVIPEFHDLQHAAYQDTIAEYRARLDKMLGEK
jgi:hypothetical protein